MKKQKFLKRQKFRKKNPKKNLRKKKVKDLDIKKIKKIAKIEALKAAKKESKKLEKSISQRSQEETKTSCDTSRIEPVVHTHVTCDGCKASPITGIRYKCTTCPDFDFCEKCEENVEHPHSFIKIKKPRGPVYTCDGCGIAPISGIRYRCTHCHNFDFCETCEANTEHPHPFLKIKPSQNTCTRNQNACPRKQNTCPRKLSNGEAINSIQNFLKSINFNGTLDIIDEPPRPLTYNCDGCGASPIKGTRYRCTVCPDFDFCGKCKKNREHSHEFNKIKKEKTEKKEKKSDNDELVKSITKSVLFSLKKKGKKTLKVKVLKNELNGPIQAGKFITQTFRLKNKGTKVWKQGTAIEFSKGDVLNPEGFVLESKVKPGEKCMVQVKFQIPNEEKQIKGIWHIKTANGKKFGKLRSRVQAIKCSDEDFEKIKIIMGMGFTVEQARKGMERGSDINMAISQIFK